MPLYLNARNLPDGEPNLTCGFKRPFVTRVASMTEGNTLLWFFVLTRVVRYTAELWSLTILFMCLKPLMC